MAKGRVAQVSFGAGELSEDLDCRNDLDRHPIGLRTLENMIVLPRGAITKRGGTEFVSAALTSFSKSRLVPFEYGITQTYVLEMGGGKWGVFKDRGRVSVPTPFCAITPADNSHFISSIGTWSGADSTAPGSIAHDATLERLKLIPDTGVARARLTVSVDPAGVGVQHILLFKTFKSIPNANADIGAGPISGATGSYRKIEGTGWHSLAFTPTGTSVILEFSLGNGGGADYVAWIDNVTIFGGGEFYLQGPYDTADLVRLKWVQSQDVIYFFHPDFPPYKLLRYGDAEWSLVRVIWKDGPYKPLNITGITITPSADTGAGITLTASGDLFTAGMVDMPVRIKKSASAWGWCVITGYTSATVVTAAVVDGGVGTAAVKDWRLGRWNADDGWPAAGAFFNERLFGTGPRVNPGRGIGSNVGNFETFSPSDFEGVVSDAHTVDYAIIADTVNAIRWFASTRVLLVGTAGGVHRLGSTGSGGGNASKMTPSDSGGNVREVAEGAADIMPVVAGNAVLMVVREGERTTGGIVGEATYGLEFDGYQVDDITVFADQLGSSDFVEMAFERGRRPTLWMPREDGQLVGISYKKSQKLIAGHRHPFRNGWVESVCVIPGASGDELWMIVRRTINGATKRYVEVMSVAFARSTALADAVFVDSALKYSGAATSSLSGLGHLEGQTVRVLGDGVDLGTFTVASGAIANLGRQVTKAVVGLQIDSVAVPMRLDLAIEGGPSLGELQQISGVTLSLQRSVGGRVGSTAADARPIKYRGVGSLPTAAPSLFSGLRHEPIDGDNSDDASLTIVHDQAYPFTVRAIVPKFGMNAR